MLIYSCLDSQELTACVRTRFDHECYVRLIISTHIRTFSASEYFSETEKFHGFPHINTSCVTSQDFWG